MSSVITNGIVNIYKEPGFTSFDVVAKLRGIFHQKKIGHTGTLDPEAVGVLPVCLGNATRVCELLTDHEKEYEALMVLGIETDSGDTSGNTISSKTFEQNISLQVFRQKLEETSLGFLGDYDQIPPMYSAKKINGKKLYEYARQGQVIERKPCKVNISKLQILDVASELTENIKKDFYLIGQGDNCEPWELINKADNNKLLWVRLRAACSKGTYIRTLCEDIAAKMGYKACMAGLIRTQVGAFDITNSLTISQLEEKISRQLPISEYVLSVDEVFKKYAALYIKDECGMKALMNGNIIMPQWLESLTGSVLDFAVGTEFRIYDLKRDFKALYHMESENEKKYLKVTKMFL